MKYIIYLIAPIILISTYGGCSDDCVNCVPGLPRDCTVFEDFIESECLGETLSNSCFGMSCETDPLVSVPVGLALQCDAIDCDSMECGDLVFTDLDFNGENILTATVMDNDVDLGNASCGFVQP